MCEIVTTTMLLTTTTTMMIDDDNKEADATNDDYCANDNGVDTFGGGAMSSLTITIQKQTV